PSSRTGLPKRSAPILPICCRRSASAWSKFGVLVANWTKCSEGTSGPNTTMAGRPMSDQLRVRDLVEEILESKRSPEEVCADTPQLLSAVCERLAQVRRVGYQLDEMFAVVEPGSRGELPSFDGTIELPIISGYDVEALLGRGGLQGRSTSTPRWDCTATTGSKLTFCAAKWTLCCRRRLPDDASRTRRPLALHVLSYSQPKHGKKYLRRSRDMSANSGFPCCRAPARPITCPL